MNRLLLIIICLSTLNTISQNNIYLVDGEIIEFDSIEFNTSENFLIYAYHNKRNILKTDYFLYSEIFSVTYDGVDTIIYYPQNENELSIENMQYFLQGKYDCNEFHKSRRFFYSGLLVGAGAAVLPIHNIISLSIPAAYCIGTTFFKPSTDKINSAVNESLI